MQYFGTNLDDYGHYTWDLTGDRMIKIGIVPKNTPFNPEELTRNLPKGEVVFFQSSNFTDLGISGSCKDERCGTKAIFWVNETASREEIIEMIYNNKLSKAIIDAMPFVEFVL